MKLTTATFNLENLDFLDDITEFNKRIVTLKRHIVRTKADILLLQEIHSQDGTFAALDKLLKGTEFEFYNRVSTYAEDGKPLSQRNLLILSKYEIVESKQYLHTIIDPPVYKMVTGESKEPMPITWERPTLYAKVDVNGLVFHIFNVHFKSKLPTPIKGETRDRFSWLSSAGWAEGAFVSSMKRLGQALELRVILDSIFDEEENAKVLVGGDFNSDLYDFPVEAITGRTENTGNPNLNPRVMIPCELSVPESTRFSLIYRGKGEMIDHILMSQELVQFYSHTRIFNETLKDESIAFATDTKFPDSDHAAVIAYFEIG